tara:strand:+ start:7653 stop:7910 length:258 start_codon:yes stop_codon:yes gene_type:complete
LDNNNMTEKQLEKLAEDIANKIMDKFTEVSIFRDYTNDDEEQELLAELAQAMTQLDYNLQKENYEKCKELQDKIKIIENKLNKFK